MGEGVAKRRMRGKGQGLIKMNTTPKSFRIAIIAGEPSGDLLGAGIIQALKAINPNIIFEGVAGPQMLAAGATTLFPMEKLSVMGFSEVLSKIFELLSLRRRVKKHFLQNPPDIFIGIDSPDFNLPIELKLKAAGIFTVHCNSPTIWGWRYNRIFKIGRAVNLMLTLFPFEAKYYEEVNIPVRYIGHPLADLIPLQNDQQAARDTLKIPQKARVIALLPGSRGGEIKYLGPILLRAAVLCLAQNPDLIFISPMINAQRAAQFREQLQNIAPQLPLQIIDGQARTAMAAADVIALASGTATLEAMLVKKPMVVAYTGAAISCYIAKKMAKVKHFSLPNILAGKELVPEYFAEQATPENVAKEVITYLQHPEKAQALIKQFTEIHLQLKCNANVRAAQAIMELYNRSVCASL